MSRARYAQGKSGRSRIPMSRAPTAGAGQQQAVPDRGEQAKVDVTQASAFTVMKSMNFRRQEQSVQRAGPVIDVGVLQYELDGDCEHHGRRHGGGKLEQHQGQNAADVHDELVKRMLHQSVQPVGPLHAVVYGMITPQRAPAVSGDMGQGDARVEHQDRERHLQPEWPAV